MHAWPCDDRCRRDRTRHRIVQTDRKLIGGNAPRRIKRSCAGRAPYIIIILSFAQSRTFCGSRPSAMCVCFAHNLFTFTIYNIYIYICMPAKSRKGFSFFGFLRTFLFLNASAVKRVSAKVPLHIYIYRRNF